MEVAIFFWYHCISWEPLNKPKHNNNINNNNSEHVAMATCEMRKEARAHAPKH